MVINIKSNKARQTIFECAWIFIFVCFFFLADFCFFFFFGSQKPDGWQFQLGLVDFAGSWHSQNSAHTFVPCTWKADNWKLKTFGPKIESGKLSTHTQHTAHTEWVANAAYEQSATCLKNAHAGDWGFGFELALGFGYWVLGQPAGRPVSWKVIWIWSTQPPTLPTLFVARYGYIISLTILYAVFCCFCWLVRFSVLFRHYKKFEKKIQLTLVLSELICTWKTKHWLNGKTWTKKDTGLSQLTKKEFCYFKKKKK